MNPSRPLAAVLLACAVFFLPIHDLAAQDKSLADVIADAEKSVVRIEVESNEGGSLGSGYIVRSSGVMVTNVHVMAGAKRAIAIFENGKKYKIKGTYVIDEARDICITQLEGSDFPELPMAKSLPRKGEEVTALGSPQGLSFTATRGIVSAIRGEKEMRQDTGRASIKGTWIQVDAALSPGNSGGPIINRNGELVAMSTLASLGGRAQNLNFGISIDDIREACKAYATKTLKPLKSGIAEVEMGEATASGALSSRKAIPTSAIDDYIEEGEETFDDLAKDLRKAHSAASGILRSMKQGKTYSPTGHDIVRQSGSRGSVRYFYRTQRIKDREVKRQQKRVKELAKIRDSIGREMTKDSLLELLWHNGPPLDARAKGSVGFISDAVVLHAANEHDVIIMYDDAPYVLWVKDTSGLSIGQELTPSPVYVEGAKTIAVEGRGTMAVTLLNSVLRSELKKAIFPNGKPEGDFRVWKNKSGKFSVTAELISHDDDQVVLKREDGKELKVPLSKLCDDDLEFLKDN